MKVEHAAMLFALLVVCASTHVSCMPGHYSNIFGFPLDETSDVPNLDESNPTQNEEDLQVVGGKEIDIKQAPYQVSLIHYRLGHHCGGSIIEPNIILTAAHCIHRANHHEFKIRAGSSIRNDGGQIYDIKNYIVHPQYVSSQWGLDYDVAVIELDNSLQFSESVKSIPIIKAGEEIQPGVMTMVTGWGNIKEGGPSAKKLQMLMIPIISAQTCSAKMKYYLITPRMLCAGDLKQYKNACHGDSGGPLVHNGVLIGAVSWAHDCKTPGLPVMYAKLSNLRPWIDETIASIGKI